MKEMTDKEINKLIRESWDMHVHVGPDMLPRKYSVASLSDEEEGKIGGIVVKSHAFSTQPTVKIQQEKKKKLNLVGSITLNNFVGGLNPDAVYASASLPTKFPLVVWFPTLHARNHVEKSKGNYEIPPDWIKDPNFVPRKKSEVRPINVIDAKGNLTKETRAVLTMIKKMDCILATGHLWWKEAKLLAQTALKMGIKVILTHVTGRDILMPLGAQKELSKKGVYVEYCYVFWLDRDNPEDYPPKESARNIKKIGPEHCIISSDTGQMRNPSPSQCLMAWVKLLGKHGLSRDNFEQMLIENPRKILGIGGNYV